LIHIVFVCFFAGFVLQQHERNAKGRNQLVKKFAKEHNFAGNVTLPEAALESIICSCTFYYTEAK